MHGLAMPRIDYSIRPAKSVERKMLAEALSRLSKLERPDNYRYVGFGAIYFRDFSLFHKMLGIHDMKSIEHNRSEETRFWSNRPLRCVEMLFGHSRVELPKAGLDEKKTIVWLDYERQLSLDVLKDVEFFCTQALAGSVLIVSLNAQTTSEDEDEDTDSSEEETSVLDHEPSVKAEKPTPLELLRKRLPGNVPIAIKGSDLAGWGTARLFRVIVENKIQEILMVRNGGLEAAQSIKYKALFDFHYADGAKMVTVGAIIYDDTQGPAVTACAFEELSYCNPANHPFRIPTPRLTYKERRSLDASLPLGEFTQVNPKGIPSKDVAEYTKVYRYFPNFAETDI